MNEDPIIIERAKDCRERDYCERCGELILPGEARYLFGIGGGTASLCVPCRIDMVASGDAIIRECAS